jgi:hypothetical protein
MKKVICTLFFLSIIGLSFGQNLELDKRNGFKQIKLGTYYLSFNGIREFPSKNPNSIIGIWKTSDSDLGYLFNEKISYFELEFDKNSKELKTMRINIVIEKPCTDPEVFERFKTINDKFIYALGKPDQTMKDTLGFMWYGKKIAMGFMLSAQEMKLDKNNRAVGLTSLILVYSSIENFKEETIKGF